MRIAVLTLVRVRHLIPRSAILATAWLVSACYQPPPYVPPTSLPTTTPVAPTAVAALQSGPAATQVAVAVATSIAATSLRIAGVSLDPQTVQNSAVTITNVGAEPVDLGGWMLLVDNFRVTIPRTDYMTVLPGKAIIVHLGTSQTPSSGPNVYVGEGALLTSPRINEDQVVLLDPAGQVASVYPAP